MRNRTNNQRNDTLKLDALGGREITAAELDQVAGGFFCGGLGVWAMNRILEARAADLLYYRCAGPCPGESP